MVVMYHYQRVDGEDLGRSPIPGPNTEAFQLTDVGPVPPPRIDPPVTDLAPRPSRVGGRGLAGIFAVSLLSAVLASTGTAAVLTGSVATNPAASPSNPNGRTVAAANGTTEDITAVVAAARESVVTITADGESSNGLSPFSVPTTGVGSGVILTSNGYILTNHHVVAGSQSLTVTFADGNELPARLVKLSDTTDLALIKVDTTGLPRHAHR